MTWPGVLVDSCVVLDAAMPFREHHSDATALLRRLSEKSIRCLIPSHAYFEFVAALVVHYKRDSGQVSVPFPGPGFDLGVEVVPVTHDYALILIGELQLSPVPDLKSQDLIYLCIARNMGLTLITQDRKLRNTCRKAGLNAFEPSEALTALSESP